MTAGTAEIARFGARFPLIVTSARPAQAHWLGVAVAVSVDTSGAFSVICSEVTLAVSVTNTTGLPVIASGTGMLDVPKSGPGTLKAWIVSSENVIPLAPLSKPPGNPTSAVT